MFDQKVAGRVKFDDINLEKGVLQDGSDAAALDWIKQEVDVNAVTGQLPDEYMRDIDIVRYDRPGERRPGAGPSTEPGSRSSSTTTSRAATPRTPSRS